MNRFINIHENLISDTSYRPCGCFATTLDDLMTEALAGSGESLTASFNADELCKHERAHEFLLEYGFKHASHYDGTETLCEFAGEQFIILADNTVVVGWEE